MKHYLNYAQSNNNYSVQHLASSIFKKLELFIFIGLSIVFLFISKANKDLSDDISNALIKSSTPLIYLVAFPVNTTIDLVSNFQELITARKENRILKKEISKLKSFYISAININQENRELKKSINFAVTKSSRYKIVNIISSSNKVFSNNILIDSGQNQGLKQGSLIFGKKSVLGRVRDLMDDKSRVLLISDSDSKIPVITSKSRVRGVLVGNNDNSMKILYLPKNHKIGVDELVFTSSDGDMITPGLLVGVVKKVANDDVKVEMLEDIAENDFVTVMEY